MAITVSPNPTTLTWNNFRPVSSLPNEDAHINIGFNLPNRPFRRVDGVFRMAEDLELGVVPQARVVSRASKTDDLLSHEQGHYNIGILTAHAMARDFMALEAATQRALADAISAAFDLHRLTRMPALQEKYDDDTNHSRNATEQARWDGLISACMARTPTCSRLDGLAL
jgi:Bacterial protein of unknown function (DUF922)